MNKTGRRFLFFRKKLHRIYVNFARNSYYYLKNNLPKIKQKGFDFFHFMKIFVHKFKEDRIFNQSAALTYVTLLGFVPFIIFTVFFLPELSFLKLETQFTEVVKSIFVPDSAEQIYEYISQLANQKISFNLFSFVVLMLTSYSLFRIINDAFDNILNAKEKTKKNFFNDIVKFIGMTIFGSLLILVLLSASSLPFLSKIYDIPILQGIFLYITPVILLFIIFTLGFFYIPTVKVSARSIIIGAAVSSAIWIFFKSFFNWYIFHLTNTKLIFGYLASVPIFLFWIYANWIIILSGVIIVSILEKRHIKEKFKKREMKKIRVIFEKIVFEDQIESLKDIKTDQNGLYQALKILTDEEENK